MRRKNPRLLFDIPGASEVVYMIHEVSTTGGNYISSRGEK